MKTRVIALAALATLALSACSSGSPSDSAAGDASAAASPTVTVGDDHQCWQRRVCRLGLLRVAWQHLGRRRKRARRRWTR